MIWYWKSCILKQSRHEFIHLLSHRGVKHHVTHVHVVLNICSKGRPIFVSLQRKGIMYTKHHRLDHKSPVSITFTHFLYPLPLAHGCRESVASCHKRRGFVQPGQINSPVHKPIPCGFPYQWTEKVQCYLFLNGVTPHVLRVIWIPVSRLSLLPDEPLCCLFLHEWGSKNTWKQNAAEFERKKMEKY